MKTTAITKTLLANLVVILSMMPSAQAQLQNTNYRSDSVVQSPTLMDEQGTADLQGKVLMQVNEGLVNGWLSPQEASQYKNQLDKLNDQESWYKSLNQSMPKALLESDVAALNQMSQRLHPKTTNLATTHKSVHSDIDDLIASSLASNRISSRDAETYYLRLAQIESSLENSKGDSAGASQQAAAMNAKLNQLKSELSTKK